MLTRLLLPLLTPPVLHGETHLDQLLAAWAQAERGRSNPARPFVTLAYAQSLDGCIAIERGKPTAISGPASLRLTHALRARHDAILIGIGTLLADDPRLDVRFVDGPSPRPVVVDSRLSCPLDAKLLQRRAQVILASTLSFGGSGGTEGDGGRERQRALEARGAEVWQLPAWSQADGWVDLPQLLTRLRQAGVERVMVEGGARILTSFLWAGLADYAVITLAPQWLGGLSAVDAPHRRALREATGSGMPRLTGAQMLRLDDNVIVAGVVAHEDASRRHVPQSDAPHKDTPPRVAAERDDPQ